MHLYITRNSWQQVFLYSVCGFICIGILAYFFYRSYIALIPLVPIAFWVMTYVEKLHIEGNKNKLKKQFREMILTVSTNLRAGYSVENAFLETYVDLVQLYGKNCQIVYELEKLNKGLSLNMTLESLLIDFACRCDIEEIKEFVDTFVVARKVGGNLAEIITSTSSMISEKIEVDGEIDVITRAGRMEQQIMSVVPFLIIFYIDMTNKNFFDALYHNFTGICIMSVCLIVYLFSIKISLNIISIKV